jgi:hypothetical protein
MADAAITHTDPKHLRLQRLRRASDFFEENRALFGSRDAFRKRLERRELNGLTASGAVLETSLGLMIDSARFRAWLLAPAVAGAVR